MTVADEPMYRNWTHLDADEAPKQKSGAGAVLRRVGAVVLNLLFIAMLLFSAFFHAANTLVGTPQSAANVLLSAALAPGVDSAIAATACTDIAQHSTPPAHAAITANPAACEASIVSTMHKPSTRLAVRMYITHAYNLIESGGAGIIDLSPIIALFTNDLYAAYPSIPHGSLLVNSGYVITIKHHSPINISGALSTTGWVLFTIGVAGAILVARFLVRHLRSQLISVGTTIGIPALATLLVGVRTSAAANAVHYIDPTAKLLVSHTAQRVGSTVAHNAILLIVTDVVVVVAWLAIVGLWRARQRTVAAERPAS